MSKNDVRGSHSTLLSVIPSQFLKRILTSIGQKIFFPFAVFIYHVLREKNKD